ncbi:BTB/POZ AND TAZ DOMAIN-CONTAINING PROTEIN 3 [Salix koriyanagi]|uniref:BTB/POZ AND TAZ DOMAIN-CONTAINING PROTEIN 3 n=1 Tax=Salix koriyanagi TaxID=2511006 RepID=A0A9Q0SV38_9ROSI|nr:BTB/POZ AND TAZ DOMAIN-CONTAINING PROTEIN 3 [Salix koriyanagi]
MSDTCNIPKPPPYPNKLSKEANNCKRILGTCSVPQEIKDTWDRLFKEVYGADVYIITDRKSYVPAHCNVLSISSPVLGNILQQSKVKDGIRYIKILGVPCEAVYMFIRFLYSSCYEEDEMKKFVLHLMVLSHAYSVPSLKRICIDFLEQDYLTRENVIDVLQLARSCNAPRLSFICVRMVVKDLKTISSTEGWKVMKRANPALEQELVESVVEADSEAVQMILAIMNLLKQLVGLTVTVHVPLCRHFKEKMQHQTKKDEAKWKLLVSKVIAAKNALGPFSARPVDLL